MTKKGTKWKKAIWNENYNNFFVGFLIVTKYAPFYACIYYIALYFWGNYIWLIYGGSNQGKCFKTQHIQVWTCNNSVCKLGFNVCQVFFFYKNTKFPKIKYLHEELLKSLKWVLWRRRGRRWWFLGVVEKKKEKNKKETIERQRRDNAIKVNKHAYLLITSKQR